jgi:hypothetical protein
VLDTRVQASKAQDAFAENFENYKVLQGHKNM